MKNAVGYKPLNVSVYRMTMGKDLLVGDIIVFHNQLYLVWNNNGTSAFNAVSLLNGHTQTFDYFDSDYHVAEYPLMLQCSIGREMNYE